MLDFHIASQHEMDVYPKGEKWRSRPHCMSCDECDEATKNASKKLGHLLLQPFTIFYLKSRRHPRPQGDGGRWLVLGMSCASPSPSLYACILNGR